ncbi:arrestin domain-containing protein 17-like [Ochlerotatus camptorhynchus]|uniref:arrestin domain-containing protein 17-like n=1 Tax=Ochlerotatus camptorhynchus TaxID=644619 RepID=UPI0031D75C06
MTINCKIRYDNNPQGIFYVGQILSGSVVLESTEPETVNAVFVKIEGFTIVQWSERRPPHGKRHRSRQFNGRQDYFNTLTYLVGAQVAPVAIEIPQGTHVHNFTCPLPDSLPTSFEGQYGHIRYTTTVVIERPSQQSTTYREAFTVLRNVNLNDNPSLREPKKLELSKSSGWWIFKSDPMDITVEIPSTGYVSGQSIPVAVVWKNNNSASIHGIRIKLYKHETYSATEPYEKSRTDSQSVVKIENRDVQNDVDGRFERSLLVPSLPPTTVSPLITIAYELAVYIHLSADDIPVLKAPITIGTIPLVALPPSARPPPPSGGDDPDQPPGYPPAYGFKFDGKPTDEQSSKAGSSTAATQMGAPVETPSTSQTAVQPHDLPPPTYEEAMSTVTNTEGDEGPSPMDSKPFIPLYPVYNFGNPDPNQQ